MNFSNFIIDKLTETDSSLALGCKKTASNPFLFADIIKVCEQENEAQLTGVLGSANQGQTHEVFSASDNVVNLNEQDFIGLIKQLTEILNVDDEIQLSETNHKVENAEITKLQFVVPEEKLVELASSFVEKTGYSLIPMSNISESNDNAKPLTISYKSGVNKISIAISSIKVDENYTNKAINDDFNFVNKLLVDEGLFQGFVSVPNATFASKYADTVDTEAKPEIVIEDETSIKSFDKVFYKAEIIKIESSLKSNDLMYSAVPQQNIRNEEFTTLENQFNQNNIKVTSSVAENVSPGYSLESLLGLQTKNQESIKPSLITPIADNYLKQASFTPRINVSNTIQVNTVVESSPLVKVTNDVESSDKTISSVNSKAVDLNTLLEGLTEEEKTVFKNFNATGDLKEINYNKTTLNKNTVDESLLVSKNNSTTVESKSNALPEFNGSLTETVSTTVSSEGKKNKNAETEVELTTKIAANIKESNLEGTKQPIKQDTVEKKTKLVSKDEFVSLDVKKVSEQVQGNNNEEILNEPNASDYVETESSNILTAKKNVSQSAETSLNHQKKDDVEKPIETITDSKLYVKVAAKGNYKTDFQTDSNNEVGDDKTAVKVSVEKGALEETNNNSIHDLAKNDKFAESQEIKSVIKDEKAATHDTKQVIKEIINQTISKHLNKTGEETETVSVVIKDNTSSNKVEAESKEQITIQQKEVKPSTENQQYSQSDKENSKSSTSDNFKNHFNHTVSTEKGFDLESMKLESEAKHSSEILKTVKQHEILPELSKMVVQGEKQTLTLQLTPENLGKVKLIVDMVDNQIVTKIEVENEQVKQFVQSNLDQLKQNMQSAGITLTNVNVSLSDEQKNQKLFTQKKKSHTRDEKEEIIEEVAQLNSKKHMGYNTYEFTA